MTSGYTVSDWELHWGAWLGEGLYVVSLVLLLGLTALEWRRAYRTEGKRLFLLAVVPLPWIAEIALGHAHPFGRLHGDPSWVEQLMGIVAFINPVLWVAAFGFFPRSWWATLPWVAFNLFVALPATVYASCSWAGACF